MKGILATLLVAGVLGLLLASAADQGADAETPVGEAQTILWGGLTNLDSQGTLVLRPDAPSLGRADADAAKAFMQAGGHVLVLPSVRAATFVHLLDLGIELGPAQVFDPDVDGRGAFEVHATPALGLSGDLRIAQSLVVHGAGEALYVTGDFVWSDVGADGRPDLDDPRGPVAVARRLPVGAGELVVLGSLELLDGPLAGALQAWSTTPVLTAAAPRSDLFGVRAVLAGGQTAAGVAVLVAAVGLALARSWRLSIRREGPRRRRGVVDQATLEILAELPLERGTTRPGDHQGRP